MNPFNLPGPQFLLFYFVLSLVTIVALWLVRRSRESAESGGARAMLNDPYLIACLRGGRSELVRVAVVSLVDRGLLSFQHDAVQTTEVGRKTAARKPIERAILTLCERPTKAGELFAADALDGATATHEVELARLGLLPDARAHATRNNLYGAAVVVLLFFALTKMAVALLRGRSNVLFLVILTAAALWIASRAAFPRRTVRGEKTLAELRNLFESLKLRAPQIRPGGATAELALLTAVWGVAALPREKFVWTRQMFPRTDSTSSSAGCGTCGSSCGSSCGGGCGGGCGGCGG